MIRSAFVIFFALGIGEASFAAENPDERRLITQFHDEVLPFLQQFCVDCHGSENPEAKLDLTTFKQPRQVASSHETWREIERRVRAGEMPPEDAEQPSDRARHQLANWVQAQRKLLASKHAGDPGMVPARRLSNAEFNYTVRDLTGIDIRPTRNFPIDPANEAGFDNSGESLAMSPALVKKYLGAAREVAEHLVLTPTGFRFAPHAVVTNTDRDKYCVKRIVEFYQRQPTDLAEYFFVCWQAAHNKEDRSITDLAEQKGLSSKYTQTVWNFLQGEDSPTGPTMQLLKMWQALREEAGNETEAHAGCSHMRDFVKAIRPKLNPFVDNLTGAGVHKGSQTFVLWKNRKYAAHRTTFQPEVLTRPERVSEMRVSDFAVEVPEDLELREQFVSDLTRFCAVFPDAFYISERGRDYLDKPNRAGEKGRLLSAGFHSMMGYFRDDQPLYDLVLDASHQTELDQLWEELNFVTSAPMRQYSGFVWFERTDSRFMRDPEFDFARAEDRSVTNQEMVQRLGEVYLAKVLRNGGEGEVLQAVEEYFENINDEIRRVEANRQEAEPRHIESLLDFATKAYRRDLTQTERLELQAYYHSLRQDDLDHESAVHDCLVSIMMAPHFCYRLDLLATGDRRPLSATELASRLSYFLWSSMPDEELRELARTGQLRESQTLIGQTKRMLQDGRVRGLANEFAGHWLDFRQFQGHNSVDRGRFPEFDDSLRDAMFEEPIRFFMDVVQRDRSVWDFLYADHTFVNRSLASHYGVSHENDSRAWHKLDNANSLGRGGLLPMAVFLTKNSPGLRTSPVKRGYWVVRQLLGERIPAPPPDVPELPMDESQLGEKTLREILQSHRAHEQCAACHQRFDSIGLVFEGYGPIGGRRQQDLGGRDVDTKAEFPDGTQGNGLAGLQRYLKGGRDQDFVDNLCRKLLAYALGRTLQLTDEELIAEMQKQLRDNDYRFQSLVTTIVTSPQFLEKRSNQVTDDGIE